MGFWYPAHRAPCSHWNGVRKRKRQECLFNIIYYIIFYSIVKKHPAHYSLPTWNGNESVITINCLIRVMKRLFQRLCASETKKHKHTAESARENEKTEKAECIAIDRHLTRAGSRGEISCLFAACFIIIIAMAWDIVPS